MGRQARVDTTEVQCISISNTTDLKSATPWHLTRHPSYNSLLHTPNSPNASVSSAAGDTAPIVCNTLSDKWRETRWFMASATGEAKVLAQISHLASRNLILVVPCLHIPVNLLAKVKSVGVRQRLS
ncbi:hypothetical protein COP2_037506 [Malus domestica]